jgi:hypothetical protein
MRTQAEAERRFRQLTQAGFTAAKRTGTQKFVLPVADLAAYSITSSAVALR